MAWWAMAGSLGLNFLSAETNKMVDETAAKAGRLVQQFNNTMVRLSDANNQNAITTNQMLSNEAFADQALMIRKGGLIAAAKTETMAAAAGVKGRSVNQAMFDVQRNAAQRDYQRQVAQKNQNLAFDQQRVNSALGAEMNQDYSYIPKPRAASYYLQAGVNSLGTAISLYA